MGLQTSELVMVALGVRGDAPPVALQPPLVDGIHLRWAFRRENGFPWYGYYLFRRPHEFRGERCLAADLLGRAPGTDLGTTFAASLGTLSSDASLVLSDDFPAAGRPEVSLDGHSAVRLDLPADEPAFRVRVQVGFRQSGEGFKCIDFRLLAAGLVANPVSVGEAIFEAQNERGRPLAQIRLAPSDTARSGVALDASGRVEIKLPAATRAVRLDMTGNARAPEFEALDEMGRVIRTASPALDSQRPRTVELVAGSDFQQFRIRSSQGEVLVHRLCWTVPAARRIELPVTAYDGLMVVDTGTVSGAPGQVTEVTLNFDRITAIEIGGGPAALVDLCAQIVPDVAEKDWQPAPNFPQPMLLPLTHPDYPLRASAQNVPAARTVALNRVVYGPAAPWSGANFSSLHTSLAALVRGGPSRPMAAPERAAQNVQGNPTPAAPGIDPPSIPSLHPLDLVLLGSLHPAVAQMVGLYWADTTADPRSSYDYLLVADRGNVANGNVATLADHILRHGWNDVDAWITFDRRMAPAPPLTPPDSVRAYALPGGTYRERGGSNAGVQEADGNVGLTWPQPLNGAGYLRPGQPVFYHVWRDNQGDGVNPQPSGQTATLVTTGGPLLISHQLAAPAETPQYPGDWPPFSLPALDLDLDEGWYGYQVNSIDIFGRFSPKSAFAEWWQWAPVPAPKPWYYIDPPGARQVHASSVRIIERNPPPPPAFIEAWALDPADPVLVRDAALDAWRQSLPAGQRNTLVGLRVRWRWNVAQQRQAPDTREFRIYWHPGTDPPVGWESVASWQIRCDVNAYASNVTVASNGDRSYDVLLPATAGQGPFGTGVPLNPTRANPIAYANVTVTAADDAAQADTWPGTGALAGRTGNESRAASVSKVYRVLREPPPPPEPVVDSDRLYSTPADWHAQSYYTFRWRPGADVFTHVFRALDESVFAADWALQPRPDLQPGDAARFPDPVAEPTWNLAKRRTVCTALNALNAFPKSDAGKQQALLAYRALSHDALRVLANMPGCEKAFVQLTVKALDPADAATADRRGPDDALGYVVRPGLRAYTDKLDGRATNRYLYRAVYVDAAQNRSAMGAVGTPVRLPNVVPPRAPVLTKVTGGDRRITLSWASNREPDLLEYRVFRAETKDDAGDLRLMQQVGTVAADPDPALRPAAEQWDDSPVPGLKDFWYRIVAVDRSDPVDPRGGGGNVSQPSSIVRGRAQQPPPAPPIVQTAVWNTGHTAVQVSWQISDPALVPRLERRQNEGEPWLVAAGWLAPGTLDATDTPPDPALPYQYRVRVRDHAGQQAESQPVATS
ncbi:MAG TPA: hypothetical protein VFQ79_04355 [Bryobacteraceae bacterium]|nr:hypothetical protein [Bryobacteraceae bacterium]